MSSWTYRIWICYLALSNKFPLCSLLILCLYAKFCAKLLVCALITLCSMVGSKCYFWYFDPRIVPKRIFTRYIINSSVEINLQNPLQNWLAKIEVFSEVSYVLDIYLWKEILFHSYLTFIIFIMTNLLIFTLPTHSSLKY